jgi:hypothetical protein
MRGAALRGDVMPKNWFSQIDERCVAWRCDTWHCGALRYDAKRGDARRSKAGCNALPLAMPSKRGDLIYRNHFTATPFNLLFDPRAE